MPTIFNEYTQLDAETTAYLREVSVFSVDNSWKYLEEEVILNKDCAYRDFVNYVKSTIIKHTSLTNPFLALLLDTPYVSVKNDLVDKNIAGLVLGIHYKKFESSPPGTTFVTYLNYLISFKFDSEAAVTIAQLQDIFGGVSGKRILDF